MEESPPRRPGLGSRFVNALRPKKSSRKLVKKSPLGYSPSQDSLRQDVVTGSSDRARSNNQRPPLSDIDIQTGERRDDTALLHGLAHQGSFDSLTSVTRLDPKHLDGDTRAGDRRIASLSQTLWDQICSLLSPSDIASLKFASKTLHHRLKSKPWHALDRPENLEHKIKFLASLDNQLPDHLFCYRCVFYHLRIRKGQERLKATDTLNPLFNCPWASEPTDIPIRMRLTPGNTLPFTFVQLIMRAHQYGEEYGISADSLSRRWKCRDSDWYHQSRYYIHKGHLLMRIVSKSFAQPGLPPSGLRHLLYSREDYWPYFSACSHWRDGELMNVCKCAVGHIPEPQKTLTEQLRAGPQFQTALRKAGPIVSLCSTCRPIRRCPECPSEYMVEIRLEEDKADSITKFKHAIVVTRWADLGDGTAPLSGEWAACNGSAKYDSFAAIGKRGLSGTFESQFGITLPGQRMRSLNPSNQKLGEDGHNWY